MYENFNNLFEIFQEFNNIPKKENSKQEINTKDQKTIEALSKKKVSVMRQKILLVDFRGSKNFKLISNTNYLETFIEKKKEKVKKESQAMMLLISSQKSNQTNFKRRLSFGKRLIPLNKENGFEKDRIN